MIEFFKNLFKKNYKFYNNKNQEIVYKEYIEKEEAIIIERNGGLEKIPVDGLKRVEE